MKMLKTFALLALAIPAFAQAATQIWGGPNCTGGGTGGTITAPGNYPEDISPTNLGASGGGACVLPSATPNTQFVRTTQDGGTTWTWVTLASIGQGAAPVVTPPPVTPPPPVVGSTAAVGSSISITWMAPTTNADGSPLSPLTAYTVYRGPTATSMVKLMTLGPASLAYSDQNLPIGPYFYAVTASNAAGESVQTPPVSVNIIAPSPAPGDPTRTQYSCTVTTPAVPSP